jgi:hypothetical protein
LPACLPARAPTQVLAEGWCGVTDANSASETNARWGGKRLLSQQTMRESAARCWPQLAAEATLLTGRAATWWCRARTWARCCGARCWPGSTSWCATARYLLRREPVLQC